MQGCSSPPCKAEETEAQVNGCTQGLTARAVGPCPCPGGSEGTSDHHHAGDCCSVESTRNETKTWVLFPTGASVSALSGPGNSLWACRPDSASCAVPTRKGRSGTADLVAASPAPPPPALGSLTGAPGLPHPATALQLLGPLCGRAGRCPNLGAAFCPRQEPHMPAPPLRPTQISSPPCTCPFLL